MPATAKRVVRVAGSSFSAARADVYWGAMDQPVATPGPLREALDAAARIVFLTGAGMSTESGIPDFRSATWLYAGGVGEEVFDIDVFRRRPEVFYAFAQRFLDAVRRARPNAGHAAMAALARRPGRSVVVVTQNIDTLHQDAGSPRVHPVHGTLATSRCEACARQVATSTLWPEIEAGAVPRHAGCGGVFKPEIVFFGEPLPEDVFAAAARAVREADLLVVAGTSLAVYPAAGLPRLRAPTCRLAIVNRTPTPLDNEADWRFHDSIGAVFGAATGEVPGSDAQG